jgi:DNA-binding YbaB/EbfC family protein
MNMQALMQQAQKMQKEITKKREELDSKEFVGKSELVEIKFTGDKKVVSVNIKEDISSDDKEILEDMISIAINDAMKKIDEEAEKIMGAYGNQFGGLF